MSFWRFTEQAGDPPQPSPEGIKKTIRVFAKDDPAAPGTTIVASVDSAGNAGDFQGPKGDQGDTGAIGPIGPPGTISSQFVADILNPTEIESLTLAGVGRELITHQVVGSSGPDVMAVYSYDADGPAKNAPYVMNTGDGGTTRWISRGGRFHQTPPNAANGDRFITAAEIIKLNTLKNELMLHGGLSNLLADGDNAVRFGEAGADAGPRMPFSGEVFAISLSLDGTRTAGTATGSFLINDVIQNGAGEQTVVDGTNPNSNHQNLATPVPFSAGDILNMEAPTVGFAPTSADATITIFIRRT